MRHIIILLLPVLVSAQKVHTFNGKHLTQKDRIILLEAKLENLEKNMADKRIMNFNTEQDNFLREKMDRRITAYREYQEYMAQQLHALVQDQNMLALKMDSLFMIIQKQDTINDLLRLRMDVRDQLDRLNSLRYNPPLPPGWIEMQPGIRPQWDTVDSIKWEPDHDGNILLSPATVPMIPNSYIQALITDTSLGAKCDCFSLPPFKKMKRHRKRKKDSPKHFGLYRGNAPYKIDRLLTRYTA